MVTGARQKDPILLLVMEGDRINTNKFHKRKKGKIRERMWYNMVAIEDVPVAIAM